MADAGAVELPGRVSVEDWIVVQMGVLELLDAVVRSEEEDHPDHVERVWKKVEVISEILLS